jgi:hypothetical protein
MAFYEAIKSWFSKDGVTLHKERNEIKVIHPQQGLTTKIYSLLTVVSERVKLLFIQENN